MSNKTSFIIHLDSLDVIDDLSDEQCGELLRAMKAYHLNNDYTPSAIVKVAFSPFKNQFIRDAKKYESIVERNRNNGLKGGRPRNPTKPTGLIGNPNEPKKADSGSKNDSDSVNDSKKEKLLSSDFSIEKVTRIKVPFQDIVNLYHEKLPTLPRIEKLTKAREGYIRQLWKDDLPDLNNWNNFFEYVGQSEFLMGKIPPINGRPPFIANLEWITKPANFVKILEEKYHGKA